MSIKATKRLTFSSFAVELFSRRDVSVECVKHECGRCVMRMYAYTARNDHVLVVDVIERYAVCNYNKRCLPFYTWAECLT